MHTYFCLFSEFTNFDSIMFAFRNIRVPVAVQNAAKQGIAGASMVSVVLEKLIAMKNHHGPKNVARQYQRQPQQSLRLLSIQRSQKSIHQT